MVHPPRPGAQCRHQTPAGLSSSSTWASLQHSEHAPQLRPGTGAGAFASLLMTDTDLSYDVRRRHDAISPIRCFTPKLGALYRNAPSYLRAQDVYWLKFRSAPLDLMFASLE